MHRKKYFYKSVRGGPFFWFSFKSEANQWILWGYDESKFDTFKKNFSLQTALKSFLSVVWHRNKEQSCYLHPFEDLQKTIRVIGLIEKIIFLKTHGKAVFLLRKQIWSQALHSWGIWRVRFWHFQEKLFTSNCSKKFSKCRMTSK